jgi:hypothetical protein
VYSITRTVIGGPSAARAGFSTARYVPSPRTRTGFNANDADARHRICAPVARIQHTGIQELLRFTKNEFAAWINGAKSGEFDHLV